MFLTPGLILTDLTRERVNSSPELAEALAARTAVKRIGDPKDVGRLVVFLASDAASYITGETITIDGGMIKTLAAPGRAPAAGSAA